MANQSAACHRVRSRPGGSRAALSLPRHSASSVLTVLRFLELLFQRCSWTYSPAVLPRLQEFCGPACKEETRKRKGAVREGMWSTKAEEKALIALSVPLLPTTAFVGFPFPFPEVTVPSALNRSSASLGRPCRALSQARLSKSLTCVSLLTSDFPFPSSCPALPAPHCFLCALLLRAALEWPASS